MDSTNMTNFITHFSLHLYVMYSWIQKIPSKNIIFCHTNTHYVGIHTANDAL